MIPLVPIMLRNLSIWQQLLDGRERGDDIGIHLGREQQHQSHQHLISGADSPEHEGNNQYRNILSFRGAGVNYACYVLPYI